MCTVVLNCVGNDPAKLTLVCVLHGAAVKLCHALNVSVPEVKKRKSILMPQSQGPSLNQC